MTTIKLLGGPLAGSICEAEIDVITVTERLWAWAGPPASHPLRVGKYERYPLTNVAMWRGWGS